MILSLAASENIPLIEAKRKIIQGTTVPKDMTFDFNNFPLLNSSKTNNNRSDNQTSNILSYNRFSVLNSSNNIENMPENVIISNSSFNGSYRVNRLSFSQTVSRSRDKNILRSQKFPQKNNNSNSHYNLLYSPNDRSPNMSNNGVDYINNNNTFTELGNENAYSPPTSCRNQESRYNNNSNVSV